MDRVPAAVEVTGDGMAGRFHDDRQGEALASGAPIPTTTSSWEP